MLLFTSAYVDASTVQGRWVVDGQMKLSVACNSMQRYVHSTSTSKGPNESLCCARCRLDRQTTTRACQQSGWAQCHSNSTTCSCPCLATAVEPSHAATASLSSLQPPGMAEGCTHSQASMAAVSWATNNSQSVTLKAWRLTAAAVGNWIGLCDGSILDFVRPTTALGANGLCDREAWQQHELQEGALLSHVMLSSSL